MNSPEEGDWVKGRDCEHCGPVKGFCYYDGLTWWCQFCREADGEPSKPPKVKKK